MSNDQANEPYESHGGYGTIEEQGDRVRLIFARHLEHPPAVVWRAITQPEHLAAWFPQTIEGERRVGARLRFVSPTGESFEGEMLEFDPPRTMAFTWGGDVLRLDLEVEGRGTRLTLTDTFDDLGKAARDAAGWHECLDRLGADLAGRALPDWGDSWRAVHPWYVQAFGPEAATLGPPQGWEERH
jgi:uncharacterized protein YndB with AHSA1/START domain